MVWRQQRQASYHRSSHDVLAGAPFRNGDWTVDNYTLHNFIANSKHQDPGALENIFPVVEPHITSQVTEMFGTEEAQKFPHNPVDRTNLHQRLKRLLSSDILPFLPMGEDTLASLLARLTSIILIAAHLLGSRKARDILAEQIHPVVLATCKKRLADLRRQDVPVAKIDEQDAPQEMWAVLLASGLRNYRGRSQLEAYVYTVVWYRLADMLTRRKAGWKLHQVSSDNLGDPMLHQVPDNKSPSPPWKFDEAQLATTCREVLTSTQWEVWRLHFYDGMDNTEIAEKLGMKANLVAQHLFQVRQRLKVHFQK